MSRSARGVAFTPDGRVLLEHARLAPAQVEEAKTARQAPGPEKAAFALGPDCLSMAISLTASTHGVALLPIHALDFLPRAVTCRPLQGEPPTIGLVLGHHKADRRRWRLGSCRGRRR